jgi:hypothetical protein
VLAQRELGERLSGYPGSRFVVLVANIHAAKSNASAADKESESMAYYLASESPITINAEWGLAKGGHHNRIPH